MGEGGFRRTEGGDKGGVRLLEEPVLGGGCGLWPLKLPVDDDELKFRIISLCELTLSNTFTVTLSSCALSASGWGGKTGLCLVGGGSNKFEKSEGTCGELNGEDPAKLLEFLVQLWTDVEPPDVVGDVQVRVRGGEMDEDLEEDDGSGRSGKK